LHLTPRFSPEQVRAGKLYSFGYDKFDWAGRLVHVSGAGELMKSAIWVYKIDKCRWELNKI
jgi:hypothetical protein